MYNYSASTFPLRVCGLRRFAVRFHRNTQEEVLSDWANAGQTQVSRDAAAGAKWDSLSEREQEVLALVCLGKRNFEIAGILGIVNETVKTHLQHIFRKFGLRSRKELRLLLRDWDFTSWWENHQI
jgi:DNA-binding CsgD family transcriptional regulator